MKYMTRLIALGLFAVGSVIFVGCGETTTTTTDDTTTETSEGDGSGTSEEENGDSASTEVGAGEVAKVSFNVDGMR